MRGGLPSIFLNFTILQKRRAYVPCNYGKSTAILLVILRVFIQYSTYSDIELLWFSKNVTEPAAVYFCEYNSKNIGKFGRACAAHSRKCFHFQKITGTLKMNIFCEHLQIHSFYFKEQSLKIKFKNKFFK